MNKQEQYRRNQIKNGRCPHCGNPCAPYYECKDRRAIKNLGYHLNRMVKAGIVEKTFSQFLPGKKIIYRTTKDIIDNMVCYKIKPDDPRYLPRIKMANKELAEPLDNSP